MEVYLDNAATTKIDDRVWEYMISLKEHYGNASCPHAMGKKAQEIIENAREIIAKKINASPNEIIFTSSGTESNNLAILGFVSANMRKRQHIITTAIEHISVIEPLEHLNYCGYDVSFLSVNSQGLIDISLLENETFHDTALISVSLANNELGTVNDIAAIGKIAKRHGIIFHCDAVTAFPHMPIDVKALGVDMMSLSAHKVYAPKGIGALYISKDIDIEPIVFGGKAEFGIRAGTENVLGIAAMGKAIEILDYSAYNKSLIYQFQQDIKINVRPAYFNNLNPEIPILNVRFDGIDGAWLVQALSNRGVYVSQGSCSNRGLSHVLFEIGLTKKQIRESIRISLSKYTTQEEIEYALKVLIELINNPKGII